MQLIDPHSGDSPKERVEGNVYAFEYTGVQFFGQLKATVLLRQQSPGAGCLHV